MALWDRLEESASQVQAQLTAKKDELTSGAFRDAGMAMCALVAAADGTAGRPNGSAWPSSSAPTTCCGTSPPTTCGAASRRTWTSSPPTSASAR